MALKAGSVVAMPDLACIGLVKKVGDAYLSQKEVYHVIAIEVEAKFGGRDGLFFVCFEPRWFGASFDPTILITEESHKPVKYGMYCRTVNGVAKPSVLVSVLGEQFEAFGNEFNALEAPSAKDVSDILRQYALGRDVGYILTQRKGEDGELMEQYNISRFFPLTDEGIKIISEQAKSAKRKTPLVITWDEE